jgi:hypothetical protein
MLDFCLLSAIVTEKGVRDYGRPGTTAAATTAEPTATGDARHAKEHRIPHHCEWRACHHTSPLVTTLWIFCRVQHSISVLGASLFFSKLIVIVGTSCSGLCTYGSTAVFGNVNFQVGGW